MSKDWTCRGFTPLVNECETGAHVKRVKLPANGVSPALLLLIPLTAIATAGDGAADLEMKHLRMIGAIASTAEKENRTAVAGNDGWWYIVPELRAISVGRFWGNEAASVSRAVKREHADPLEAITDFHSQLKQAGIELVIVPVPAKVVIYPEHLRADLSYPSGQLPARLDVYDQEFYEVLRERGIDVIDLVPLFLNERKPAAEALYCKTDSHWSGRGAMLAATAIADHVRLRPWLKQLPTEKYTTEQLTINIQGDLGKIINEINPVIETLQITICGQKKGDRIVPNEISRASPVLIMGDSHTLVFHDPTLFASGAGLPDHVAQQLGITVDLIGVRGSGATTTRIELLRRKDNLEGKKLVIWCFSVREFTESETGWRKIPVIRP